MDQLGKTTLLGLLQLVRNCANLGGSNKLG